MSAATRVVQPDGVATNMSQHNSSNNKLVNNDVTVSTTVATSPTMNHQPPTVRPSALEIPSPSGSIVVIKESPSLNNNTSTEGSTSTSAFSFKRFAKRCLKKLQGKSSEKSYLLLAKTINIYVHRIQLIQFLIHVLQTAHGVVNADELLQLHLQLDALIDANTKERELLKQSIESKIAKAHQSNGSSKIKVDFIDPMKPENLLISIEEDETKLTQPPLPQTGISKKQARAITSVYLKQLSLVEQNVIMIEKLITRIQQLNFPSIVYQLRTSCNDFVNLRNALARQEKLPSAVTTPSHSSVDVPEIKENIDSNSVKNQTPTPNNASYAYSHNSTPSRASNNNNTNNTVIFTHQLALMKRLLRSYEESELIIQDLIKSADDANDKLTIANLLTQSEKVKELARAATLQQTVFKNSIGPRPCLPRRTSSEYQLNEASTAKEVSQNSSMNVTIGGSPGLSTSSSFSNITGNGAMPNSSQWGNSQIQTVLQSPPLSAESEDSMETSDHTPILPPRPGNESSRTSLSTIKPVTIEPSRPSLPPRQTIS